MNATERRLWLLENIARLRRVERELPRNRDLVDARAALEEDLGDTVSRRLAARFLGVSHTALDRWVKSGDLPLTQDPTGRIGIPVAALLRLHDAVTDARLAQGRQRHVLEPAVSEGRRRAAATRFSDIVPRSSGDTYDRADRRSLAYHRVLARRLTRPMIDEALHRVWKWRDQGKLDPLYADAWEDLLTRPVAEVRRAIAADDPHSHDLRQNSPLAGMLSEPERRRLIEEVR